MFMVKALFLIKGPYSRKQSSEIWHPRFHKFLIFVGFRPILSNNCVFINHETGVIISVYTDDLLIFSAKKSHLNDVKI